MNRVLNLAIFNIRVLLSERTWFFLAWALFGLQFAVFGSMMSRLVGASVPDYNYFYGVGLMVIIVFDSAADVGRHFVEHAHEGELPYFLSLPLSRRGFLASQAIYGVTNTLLKVAPPLLVFLYFWGQLTPSGALFAIGSLFILGLGISGFMISMSFIAFKSVDLYSAVIAGLSALLVRFSTVFYPLSKIPGYYSPVAYLSPLTWGAELTRSLIGFGPPDVSVSPVLAVAVVVAVAIGTLAFSTRVVDNIIEGVKAS